MHLRLRINYHVLWFIILIAVLKVQGHVTSTPKYESMCNKTVTILSTSPVGRLHYTHYADDNKTCSITIETETDRQVGFFFLETSAFQAIHIEDDVLFYSCRTWVQLADGSHRLSNTRCVYSNYNNDIHVTTSNKLKIQVTGDDVTTFFFDLVFYSFHDGPCERQEQKCNHNYKADNNNNSDKNICIHTDLMCDSAYSHVVCNASETSCSDIVEDEGGSFVSKPTLIVFLCTLIVFVVGIFFMANLRRRCCKSTEEEVMEDVPTIAHALFGSVTSDSGDNDVFQSLSDIDSSKFDPPPEYSTLEMCNHISSKDNDVSEKSESRMSVVSLPSYSDAMKHCAEYSVASHM